MSLHVAHTGYKLLPGIILGAGIICKGFYPFLMTISHTEEILWQNTTNGSFCIERSLAKGAQSRIYLALSALCEGGKKIGL